MFLVEDSKYESLFVSHVCMCYFKNSSNAEHIICRKIRQFLKSTHRLDAAEQGRC